MVLIEHLYKTEALFPSQLINPKSGNCFFQPLKVELLHTTRHQNQKTSDGPVQMELEILENKVQISKKLQRLQQQ